MEKKLKIGSNIRKWRNLKGLKQKDLAVAMQLSEAAMSNIENNITDVTLGQLDVIAAALEVSINQLFTDPQETISSPKSYKQQTHTSGVEESQLLYAVIRSLEMKDQQLQAIVQNVLHTMTALAGNSVKPVHGS